MVLSSNDSDPQPQSSHQESGVDGFSADLKHDFTNEESLSKIEASEKSSVKPIIGCFLVKAGMFEEEEEETCLAVKAKLAPTLRLCEEEPLAQSVAEAEQAEEPDSIIIQEMKSDADQTEGPNKEEKKNKVKNRRSRCLKTWGLAVVLVVLVVGVISWIIPKETSGLDTNGAPSGCDNCFMCADKAKCPNLNAIYKDLEDDLPIFQRKPNETFPVCDVMTPAANNSCSVCWNQNDLHLCCSEGIAKFQAEDSYGGTIKNISNCTWKSEPVRSGATIYSKLGYHSSAFFILVGVQLIYFN